MFNQQNSMKKKGGLSLVLTTICLILTIISHTKALSSTIKKPYTVEIHSLPVGFATYALGVGLATEINKYSTWLRATSIEGKSPDVHIKMMIKDPEKKKHVITFSDSWIPWAGQNEIGPFKGWSYDYSKFVGLYTMGCGPNGLVAVDPKIKTLEDARGKKFVPSSTKGGIVDAVLNSILKEAGILDDLKLEWMKPEAAADALKDGLVSMIQVPLSFFALPNTYRPGPTLVELMALKPVNFISIPRKHVEDFAKKTGCPVTPLTIPPRMIGPLQTDPWEVINKHIFWSVHVDMPDEVVNEILSIVYERTHVFKDYHPAGAMILTKETMATMGLPEKAIHPAALKFYKEKRIPITYFK